MKATRTRSGMAEELVIAIGLIWGHLNVRQFEQAYMLARGCQQVWPEESRLRVMEICASVELHYPLDADARAALLAADCKEWTDMILLRAQRHAEEDPTNPEDG